jgi:hypothetical protein
MPENGHLDGTPTGIFRRKTLELKADKKKRTVPKQEYVDMTLALLDNIDYLRTELDRYRN